MKKSENNNYLKFNRNLGTLQKEKVVIKDNLNIEIILKYLIPAALAFICYINGLNGDFVHDDIFAIKKNPDVHGKTELWNLLKNDFWGKSISSTTSHKSYRPLTVFTFRLNYILAGLDPFFYHVINVTLHVIVTTLFVYTCKNILGQRTRDAVLAGSLFAVHPIHTEAVSGIVGRADVLAATFFLLSFITFSKCTTSTNNKYGTLLYLSSLMCAAAAMLSKETGVTVLGVCIIYDSIRTLNSLRKEWTDKLFSNFLARLVLTIVFTVLLLSYRLWIMDGSLPTFTKADNPASYNDSISIRFYTYGFLLVLNLWMLVAPINLCYDWQHGSVPLVENVTDPRNLATFTVILLVVYLICVSLSNSIKKHNHLLLMALMLTAIPFLPASNLFFPVGFVLAERVLYIPSMGFCLLVSAGFFQLFDAMKCYRSYLTTFLMILLLMFSLKTWQQNKVWQSRKTLFKAGVEALTYNAKTHYNYGNYLKDGHEYEKARYHYLEALRLDNEYASAHNNLGTLLDDKTKAEAHFREAIRLQPSHQSAHINLGNLLFKRGLKNDGINYLYKAVEIEYRNPEALSSLGESLIEIGNFTQAEVYLQTAIEVSPDFFEAYTRYAYLLSKTNRHEESAIYYKKAYELDSSQSAALVNAAHEYKSMGFTTDAEVLLKRALTIRRDVNTLEQLAILYYTAGRTMEALAVYDDIEKLNENSTETLVRHAKVVANNGDFRKAEDMMQKALLNSPVSVEYLTTFAHLKSKLKKYEQAIEYLSKAVDLMIRSDEESDEDLDQLYVDRGNNYKDMKMFSKALLDYEAALRINPRHPTAHGNCGAIYHMNGSIEKAKEHYTKALELNPDSEIIRGNIAKLGRLQYQRDTGVG
ncbi:protein O-mannosyl-transferase TMTC1-like isoform X2 [Ruditapes philippinarum]|uniref:protein O-mannosyl-transferase TMTC1-like isoform X2 n=1 Tax=Ruditapes philippinarum TaxID=129788 RepID=UPI00295AF634|nr:protein O-mannosyl-transferase TMTC1-like isoform X2 [Ruditapes philippinarum]